MVCKDFIQVASDRIIARSTTTGYDAINTMVLDELSRRHRASDLTKSDILPLYVIDFGAAQALNGIFLNHVNFNKVRLFGHASDLAADWSTATYKSGDVTISQNIYTGRYNLYHNLGGSFSYRFLAVGTPAACTVVGDYTTYWECSMIALLETVTTLSNNMSYGYQRTAEQVIRETQLPFGGKSRISPESILVRQWRGVLNFGHRTETNEAELWTINRYPMNKPLFFYENRSSTQDGYICFRDTPYRGTLISSSVSQGNTIELVEVI